MGLELRGDQSKGSEKSRGVTWSGIVDRGLLSFPLLFEREALSGLRGPHSTALPSLTRHRQASLPHSSSTQEAFL